MGLFDRLKKKKEAEIQKQENQMESHLRKGKDGLNYLECEYYNPQADFKKFYDTTKLVVCTTPEVLPSGKTVYSARVAHYGSYDAIYFSNDEQMTDLGRRNQFTKIRLGVDFDKLVNDTEYQKVLMDGLLDKKRVERYIYAGLQDHPSEQLQCGDYIGYVDINQKTGRYGKIFDPKVGEEVHNLPEQVQARNLHKQSKERAREERIAQLEAERAKLDRQIAIEKGIYTPDGNER